MSEWPRPVRLDAIGSAAHPVAIDADARERAALAARFGLLALDRLEARGELTRDGARMRAIGSIAADVVQACVATDAPVPASVVARFDLRFVPTADLAAASEVELDAAALDVVPYDGGAIDLGEAAAQTLALALDPWPRSPASDVALRAAGVLREGEEKVSPFAALKGLLGH